MSVKKNLGIFILLTVSCFIISCQKPGNTIAGLGSPLLVLTPSSDSGYASDKVAIDYSMTAANGIKQIQIYTQFLSNPKITVKDSTLPTAEPVEDLNFVYTIPDSATRGQQTVITFVITDGKGNATTKTATVTVIGTRPFITVTPSVTSASADSTVVYTVVMKSLDKPILSLNVSQIINGSATSLQGAAYSGNQLSVTTTYKYQVPPASNPGDVIGLLFTVSNSSSVTNFTSVTVNVK